MSNPSTPAPIAGSMTDRQAPLEAWHHAPVALPLPRVAHVVQAVDGARTAAIGFDGAPWIADGPLGAVVYDLAPEDERRLLRAAPRRVFQIRFDPTAGDLVIRLLRRDVCLDTFVAIGPGAPRLTDRERARLRERIAARFGIAPGFFALPAELD